ncbi:S-adenosyl-L-methionine-dependent methyltransferase [Podospora aff. communis PSN243]|uniref:S-adenosyl-L-methionine-dependent methyltransferase n=1 Tax=Podospora aff. communis PSN243 TaxID=3040156 RepID=A0AAV9GPF9_9PEZI|nr:S-adenosyl-L-methionine-dependent methyltransferase [Podospora aff. communis PSN243]
MAGTNEQQVDIAVDPLFGQTDENDGDSTLGGEGTVSTASLNSTILEYRKLHGRTYQNDSEYWGPNDKTRTEQLDINHHLLTVLDVGTGTGVWAIDFADEFPESEVTGIDLSPIQPSWVPPNCKFVIDDASKPWTYPDNSFDYIHIRYMLGSFKDWVAVYREAYRCLKPGGWIEHMDCAPSLYADDASMPKPNIFEDWFGVFQKAGEIMGQTFDVISNDQYIRWMEEAGFKDVKEGSEAASALEMGLEGFGLFVLTNIMGWKYEEAQAFLQKVKAGLRNKSYHGYCLWETAWAQKPLE